MNVLVLAIALVAGIVSIFDYLTDRAVATMRENMRLTA